MDAPPVARRIPTRFEPEQEARFRESRVTGLAAVNLNTFWWTAILLLSFGFWDVFADREHWRLAFSVRAAGVFVIVGTGLFQRIPGNELWMPFMAKVRLVVAVVSSVLAATMLERGYGFGIAGTTAIFLTGAYIAIDTRDLLKTNLAALLALAVVLWIASIDRFDVIGTAVFALLATAVSLLLGRVLELSHRRAFALELALHRDARTDSLTGLNNRRAMQERGRAELKRAKRSGAPMSLLVCDLDHFKKINDRHGHEMGDSALAAVASILQASLREPDSLGRWGGEEFITILPATGITGAREVAERMRMAVAAAPVDGLGGRLTISAGIATLTEVHDLDTAWDTLVKEADQNLYRAKSDGRNRVPVSSLPNSEGRAARLV